MGISYFSEVSGEQSKLGIINRFHRTLRDMLRKVLNHYGSHRWLDYAANVLFNYNHRYHSTLRKSPASMTAPDVRSLNRRLLHLNQASISRFNEFSIGDRVRYLMEKGRFDKGVRKYSNTVWTVFRINQYNITIYRDDKNLERKYLDKKYWQLKKVDEYRQFKDVD